MSSDANRSPRPFRSDPKVVHANAFVGRFVVVMVALTVSNTVVAYLFGPSPFAVIVSFLLTLAAAWLLIHMLFDRIDDLLTDRLDEIEN